MSFFQRIKPAFLDHRSESTGLYKSLYDFRTLWKQSIATTLLVVLAPLFALAYMDYRISLKSAESEVRLRAERVTSNARRTIRANLDAHRYSLNFILRDNSFAELNDDTRLDEILGHLRSGLGAWNDLGLIDKHGIQVNYSGPFYVEGNSYTGQSWYQTLLAKERQPSDPVNPIYTVSDVFLGYRNEPHFVLAVRGDQTGESPYVLAARVGIDKFGQMLSDPMLAGSGDAFLINHEGILQTPSRLYGEALTKSPLPVPPFAERTEVFASRDHKNREIITGYAYIIGTPFILMVVKQKETAMSAWRDSFAQLFLFLLSSVAVIAFVVFAISTYLVNSIYLADQKRLASLHHIEYSNKMASIGRLSAGVAHEINNPLAIINEKAGLIKDLFTFRKEYAADQRLIGLIDSIIQSVERCATITRQMLSFARNTQAGLQKVNIRQIIADVLEFQVKEASYRGVAITVNVADEVPEFMCDRGKLQQIFINLVNNAIAAMQEGGKLNIVSRLSSDHKQIITKVSDTGCGIPPENLKKIFEPFFTTKSGSGGTGLGLSITYGLVQEIGGTIDIESTVDVGTTFIVALPLIAVANTQGENDARTAG